MWIICEPLRSALESEDSNSGSPLPRAEDPALWVTSSGTPTLRQSCWRGWKTRPWSQRLFGAATLPSSRLTRSLVKWISSRRATPALPSPQPQGGTTQPRTSGPTLRTLFGESNLDLFSEKTLPGRENICVWCAMTFKRWATGFRPPVSLGPPTWVRLIAGRECSYLATPTATANQLSRSMRKHPGCAAYHKMGVTGQNLPTFWEWTMGLPHGWTDYVASEMPLSPNKPPSPSNS